VINGKPEKHVSYSHWADDFIDYELRAKFKPNLRDVLN